ncbi:LCP family protein [Actinophytocola sp.]|uniref:LCP family protein n=1 Tax=Actinophytocola sp. TaxID=1872138 RepID=UPI003D6C41EE
MNRRPPRSDGQPAREGREPPAGRRASANAGRVVGGPASGSRPSRTSDARWLPRADEPTEKIASGRRPRPGPQPRPRRRLLVSGKFVLTVVSVLILAVTGYYWRELKPWQDGLTTADVIDQAPTERPADGAIDILMVGMDSRTDAQGNPLSDEQLAQLRVGESDEVLNTDTLIMIRIPNDGRKAVGLSLPRDSFVEIPGYGEHKINSAYLRAKNDAMRRLRDEGVADESDLQVRSNQEGAKNLIATVQKLTGATIDHYAEVNLLGFYDITKAVGGIDVCLKEPVDDWRSGARFKAGRQNLSGTRALAFVRQRHGLPNGDLDRIVRQQVFMTGMAKKVFSQDMLTPGSEALDRLRDAVQKSVVLDEDWNVIEFAQQMMNFTGGNVSFQTIPVGRIDLETPEDGSAVEVDPDEVQAFVEGLLGKKPAPENGEPDEGDGDDAANEQVTVNVRNASGQAGVAQAVADSLAGKGFTTGDVGNADLRDTTVVRYADGEQDSGDQVGEAIGGNPVVEPDPNLPPGTVTILLGADYDAGSVADASGDGLAHPPLLRLAPGAAQQVGQPDEAGCVY